MNKTGMRWEMEKLTVTLTLHQLKRTNANLFITAFYFMVVYLLGFGWYLQKLNYNALIMTPNLFNSLLTFKYVKNISK